MPSPVASDLHVDALLTAASIGVVNTAYSADGLFPVLQVAKETGKIPKYNKSAWFRDDAKIRAYGAKSLGGGFTVDNSTTYSTDWYSRRFEIADQVRRAQDAPYNMDMDAMRFVTDKMMMRRDVSFAANFFALTKWTTDVTGGADFTQWDDYANSDPLGDVDGWKETVETLIMAEPGVFMIGKQVWTKLKHHPDLIDRIKYTQRAQISVDLAASLMELDRIQLGKSIYTTSPEGTAEGSVTYSRIWGKNGLLLFVTPSPSLFSPTAGYTIVWTVVPNALQYIKRMRDEEKEIDIIEANSYFQHKQFLGDAGLFASGLVT